MDSEICCATRIQIGTYDRSTELQLEISEINHVRDLASQIGEMLAISASISLPEVPEHREKKVRLDQESEDTRNDTFLTISDSGEWELQAHFPTSFPKDFSF